MNSLLNQCNTFVINLKERSDKKKKIQKVFEKKKIKYSFFHATKHENPKRGCLESHFQIIENAYLSGYKRILIFEDDVKFIRSIKELPDPPQDWDMIYLGGTVHRILDEKNKNYPRVQTWTTHAYFINLENENFIKDVLLMKEYEEEVDRYYLEKIHPKYKCYMAKPMCCIQNEGYSDIEGQDVNYDFMQHTLNGLRIPENEIDENGHYILKLPKIDIKDLPKVSIVTPTYNRRKLFTMALNNFENFMYPQNKLEWVIVDDTPDDDDSVQDLVGHMKNVKYIRFRSKEEPMTVAAKRNIGAANATSNYIVHMDDDDYYPPESVLARIKLLLKYEKEDIGCVGSSLIGTYNILNNTSSMSSDGPISLSEASMAYTRKFWEERGFDDLCIRGEHKYFTEQRLHKILDVPYSFILIAINHKTNMSNELRGDENLLKYAENTDNYGEVANFFDTWDLETQMFIISLRSYILK